MKLVLLSGGSGKRLWPMSNDVRSKQFLRVLEGEGGERISMLQRVWGQLSKVGLADHTFMCASEAQCEVIHSQLGDGVSVIVEPARMDTFPAIALCATYLMQDTPSDEVVVVAPVDQYVEDGYFEALRDLPAALEASGADIALLGVRPSHASNQFGYICVEQDGSGVGRGWKVVRSFKEKPDRAAAEELIREGALWNCGVFCFRLSYLHELLVARGYPDRYQSLFDGFVGMPKRSFDYEVVEAARRIAVKPYAGMWKDLGTWSALAGELDQAFMGPGLASNCEGSHIINELNIPIVAKGLRDLMIVASPDGILVADKAHSADIKDAVNEVSVRPMFEESRWGSYRVLDYTKLDDGAEVLTKYVVLRPGANISYQKHALREEVWTVVSGAGVVVIDGRVTRISVGQVVRICPGQWHAIRADGELALIEVQRGDRLIEEDITRYYVEWDEIMEHVTVVGL